MFCINKFILDGSMLAKAFAPLALSPVFLEFIYKFFYWYKVSFVVN